MASLSPAQIRYQELTKNSGLTHEAALCAIGRYRGPAPEFARLSRNEQVQEIDRLKSQGLTQSEAERVLGVFVTGQNGAQVKSTSPTALTTEKRSRKGQKRKKGFAAYYNALARPDLSGLRGSRK